MQKIIVFILAASALAGCLSTAPKSATKWTIDGVKTAATIDAFTRPQAATNATAPIVRLASVTVRAPYDTRHLVVLRPDGSLAFDPYNEFAAQPASLIRSAAEKASRDSGLFSYVIAHNSNANAACTLEWTLTRLALDCRENASKSALVELSILLTSSRAILAESVATASIPVQNDNMDFTAAFSQAFSEAAAKALDQLKNATQNIK
jgi:ABC-type uncharacterized transport system auxiliary subunit